MSFPMLMVFLEVIVSAIAGVWVRLRRLVLYQEP